MALSLQQKWVPENISAGKALQARKADNVTAIYESIVSKQHGNLDIWQTYRPTRPVAGTALLSHLTFIQILTHISASRN
jgi:hypothetical protein